MEGGVPKELGLPLDPVLPEGGVSSGSPAAEVVVDKVGPPSCPRFISLDHVVVGRRKSGESSLSGTSRDARVLHPTAARFMRKYSLKKTSFPGHET